MKTRTIYVVNGVVCTSLESAQELMKNVKTMYLVNHKIN